VHGGAESTEESSRRKPNPCGRTSAGDECDGAVKVEWAVTAHDGNATQSRADACRLDGGGDEVLRAVQARDEVALSNAEILRDIGHGAALDEQTLSNGAKGVRERFDG
jgi:hypothetical protein